MNLNGNASSNDNDLRWLNRAAVVADSSPCSVRIGAILLCVKTTGRIYYGVNRPPGSHPQGIQIGRDSATGCDAWCVRRRVPVAQKCPGYTDCETVHAETWALQKAGGEATGGVLYVTSPPCNMCARSIAGAGVARVVFWATEALARERRMDLSVAYMMKCGIHVRVAEK